MDKKIEQKLNKCFAQNFANAYKSRPEVKSLEDTNHFYITNPDSNIICFIPENLLF
jgi:hypothetical protein